MASARLDHQPASPLVGPGGLPTRRGQCHQRLPQAPAIPTPATAHAGGEPGILRPVNPGEGATLLQVLQEGAGAPVHLLGELDLFTLAVVQAALAPFPSRCRPVCVELSGLALTGKQGIQPFIRIARQRTEDGPPILVNPPPWVIRVLDVLKQLPDLVIGADESWPWEQTVAGGRRPAATWLPRVASVNRVGDHPGRQRRRDRQSPIDELRWSRSGRESLSWLPYGAGCAIARAGGPWHRWSRQMAFGARPHRRVQTTSGVVKADHRVRVASPRESPGLRISRRDDPIVGQAAAGAWASPRRPPVPCRLGWAGACDCPCIGHGSVERPGPMSPYSRRGRA